ncbi:MAG: type IX secretion system sortase PorU, partial [Acidobacteriota bacterium]
IAEYPTVITPQGRRKPDARQAIIDQVNRGTLLLNFTGHGNYTVWAHESILSLEDTKMPFSNDDKLPFVIAATCDWGRFDMTEYQSSAEEMMKNQNGGAIGVLSATRAVISADNASMNQTFYRYLLSENPFSPTPRLGDAVMQTKNDPGSGQRDNTAKYHLLCDPTLRLARPGLTMTIDSVNGAAVSDLKPALVGALQKVNVTAGVRAQDKTIDRTFNGTAIVTVFDAGTDAPLPNFSMTYKKQGAILYKGENSVVDGRLSASFIVPKDISYDSSNGRISVYFSSSSADGHGYTSNIIIAGTAGALTDDRQGPNVSVCFDAPSFRSGDVVGPEPTLIVALSDSSGINSTGTGIGHRIEAWIDGNPRSIDLTPYYRSRRDSYQEGTVEYRLPKMEEGMHNIAVKAWDVYNNPSTAEASFTVAPGGGLSIVNLFNFPNPAMRQTTFTFQHQQLAPVDVQIRIFTVAGRLVARLERFAISSRFVQIPWDCRDNDGDMLGNGVYFYQVRIKTADGSQSAEALGRLAIMR